MIIWLDDIREPPTKPKWIENHGYENYEWCHSVNEAIRLIEKIESFSDYDEYIGPYIAGIDCDHDLGDYASDGGDGIRLLDWLEEKGLCFRIGIHTMNPVGRINMQAIVEKNNWIKI